MKSILGISAIALILATSCNNGSKSSSSEAENVKLENFTNDSNAAKQQLFLRLVEESSTDSSTVYVAKSLFDKDTVGLKLEVLNAIKPGINKDGQPEASGFIKGAMRISSIGAQSDNLVKALGTLFKSPGEAMTSEVIVPTVFSSNKDTVDLKKQGTYSFKLFLDNKEGEPAELFAVLDTYRKSIQLSEKDSTYRTRVISALSGK